MTIVRAQRLRLWRQQLSVLAELAAHSTCTPYRLIHSNLSSPSCSSRIITGGNSNTIFLGYSGRLTRPKSSSMTKMLVSPAINCNNIIFSRETERSRYHLHRQDHTSQCLRQRNRQAFSTASGDSDRKSTHALKTSDDVSIAFASKCDDYNTDEDTSNTTVGATKTNRKLPIVTAYLDLAKARLSALVVATTAAGYGAAGSVGFLDTTTATYHYDTFTACVVGTALCSASAAALNQIFEVDRDKRMKRTQQRPLVQNTLTMSQATTAAVVWGVSGVGLLYGCIDHSPLTAILGATNIGLYAGAYTYLKPKSIVNTWVGALVGAIPPVMGWTAAMSSTSTAVTLGTSSSMFMPLLDPPAIMLGSLLYLWQMPHFFALSYMYREDYARGGFQMVPCLESDGDHTSRLVVRYTWYQSTIPFIAYMTDVTSSMFCLEGLVLNACALHLAYRFRRERTNANARKVFLFSLSYLPCLLMLFLLHSKTWDTTASIEAGSDEHQLDDDWMSQQVHAIRDKGRELCPHEQAVVVNTNTTTAATVPNAADASSEAACPVTSLVQTTKQEVKQDMKALIEATAISQPVAIVTNDGVEPNASDGNKS